MDFPRETSVANVIDRTACGWGCGAGLDTAELLVDLRLSLLFAEIRLLLTPDVDFALTLEGWVAPLDRLRFLMTSVFKLSGRTTPWSFKNNPQALQRGWPSGFLLQRGVVVVLQLVHRVIPLMAPGILARLCWPWDSRLPEISGKVASVLSRRSDEYEFSCESAESSFKR